MTGNLEDISAPRCFEIEERLKEILDIPVFHDDQHGTAIVVLAGIINSLKITGKKKEACRVVVNGAGSAGIAITKLLLRYGFTQITICDRYGIIGPDYPDLNWMQKEMANVTNLAHQTGTLKDAIKGADIFVGVSAPNLVTRRGPAYAGAGRRRLRRPQCGGRADGDAGQRIPGTAGGPGRMWGRSSRCRNS